LILPVKLEVLDMSDRQKDIKNTTNPENEVTIPLTPIQEDEIDANAVGDVQIKNGAITAKKIRAGSIIGDHILAGTITAKQLHSNAITTYSLAVVNRFRGSTVVFSASGSIISWTLGVIYLNKVTFGDNLQEITEDTIQQNVSSDSYDFTSGGTAFYFYVTWTAGDDGEPIADANISVSKLADYPTGENVIPLCYSWYDATLHLAQFRMIEAKGGVKISGDSIFAGSITATNIKANTITTDRLNFTPYVIGSNSLDDVANGTTYKRVKSASVDANGLVTMDTVTEGTTYKRVKSASVTVDGLVTMDTVSDGSTYAKVYSTNITAGAIKLTGVVNDSGQQLLTQSNGYIQPYINNPAPNGSGLFIGYQKMGYYSGSAWATYMDYSGNFYLKSSGISYLSWTSSSSTLTIGNTSGKHINITSSSLQLKYGSTVHIDIGQSEITIGSASSGSYIYISSGSIQVKNISNGYYLGIQGDALYFYDTLKTYGGLSTNGSYLTITSATVPIYIGGSSYETRIFGYPITMYSSTTEIAFFGTTTSIFYSNIVTNSGYIESASYLKGSYVQATGADWTMGNDYGIAKSSGYKINWDSSSFRFYDGTYTIQFRYYDGKIQGKAGTGDWYDL